jgi:hypothetical protein
MKKLLTVIFFLAGSCLFAQTYSQYPPKPQPAPQQARQSGPMIRLHGYTTYAFNDNHVESYSSETNYFVGSVKGGFQYGGGLEIMPAPALGIEFSYLRLSSTSDLDYYDGLIEDNTVYDLAHNYLFLSVNKYIPVNPKIEPYGAMELGMAIYNIENPDNGNSSSATKFAWGLKAGINIWANERVGIKLQTSLISAVQAIGGGIYFGTGGTGAGFSGFSTYYQFNLGGGLVFRIK